MRRAVVAVVIVAFVGLLIWRTGETLKARQRAAQDSQGFRSRGPRRVPVQVARAQRATLVLRASYVGEVAARAKVDVFPRIAGIVSDLPVGEGDPVRTGQVVARLDPKDLRFQEQAQSSVSTQRVQVEQAWAAGRTARLAVDQARAGLTTQRARLAQLEAGAPPEQIRQAEEAVRQAQANLAYSREQLRRTEELFAQGFVARQAVDAARLDVTVKEAALRTAEETLNLLRRGPRPEEVEVSRGLLRQAEVSLQEAQSRAAQAEVSLRQAQSVLAQTQVTLRQAQALLANSVIRAPAAGIVGRRLVDVGATVTTATPLMQLVDVTSVLITIPVAERDLGLVTVGVDAAVAAEAVPGRTFAGRIVAISPLLASATRTAEIKVEVGNGEGLLRPGMAARVDLVLARHTNVVTIPIEAVLERDGAQTVFVVEESTARERMVQTGISEGNRIEVRKGVRPGERVVIAGQNNLRDGMTVFVPGTGRGFRGRPGGTPGQERGRGRGQPGGSAAPTPSPQPTP